MQPVVALPGVHAFGLRKRWGATQAVDGVDLVIAPGEVVALLGPNGAGKSTTIDMLLGLAPPDAGTVTMWGMSPGGSGLALLGERVAAVGGRLTAGERHEGGWRLSVEVPA